MAGYRDSVRVNNLGSASRAYAITPHNDNALDPTVRALYIGTPGSTGSITVKLAGTDDDVVFTGIPAGTILPIIVTHVRDTGTDASDIVGLL